MAGSKNTYRPGVCATWRSTTHVSLASRPCQTHSWPMKSTECYGMGIERKPSHLTVLKGKLGWSSNITSSKAEERWMENLRKKEVIKEFWNSAIWPRAPFGTNTSSLTTSRADRRLTRISIGSHADHDPGHKDVQEQFAQKHCGNSSRAPFAHGLEVDFWNATMLYILKGRSAFISATDALKLHDTC